MNRTVFISSTYEDLKPHRKKIWELLERFDVTVRGMERFGARKETALETCMTEVAQSDIYVGILAYRLGSIDAGSGKSFTQLEYEKAYDLKKDIFLYFADEVDSKIPPIYFDMGEKAERLASLKSILKERHTVDTFINEDDLSEKLKRKFNEVLLQKDESTNEYRNSYETLQGLLLVPKEFSGKEVQLKVKFKGEPFAASKVICNSFNLEYGRTIGVDVDLLQPAIKDDVFTRVFIEWKLIKDRPSIEKNKISEIFVKCQFSEESIENLRANFVEKSYYEFDDSFMSPSIFSNGFPTYGKLKTIKAEGRIILVLTRFIRNEQDLVDSPSHNNPSSADE